VTVTATVQLFLIDNINIHCIKGSIEELQGRL